MVNVDKIYVIMSTIAVILNEPSKPVSIDPKAMEAVLARPLAIGQSLEGLMISSQRDQIEVVLNPNRINVRDLGGKSTFRQSRIPFVLDFFMQLLATDSLSYGINFLITVPCSEPRQWVTDKILNPQISEKTGKVLMGGGASLRISSEPKVWNVKLDPTDEQTIQLDFNASEQAKKLPDQSRLCEELQEQFDALLGFLTSLGL